MEERKQSMRTKTSRGERSKVDDKSLGLCLSVQMRRGRRRPAGRLLPFIGRQINRGPPGARRATISV